MPLTALALAALLYWRLRTDSKRVRRRATEHASTCTGDALRRALAKWEPKGRKGT